MSNSNSGDRASSDPESSTALSDDEAIVFYETEDGMVLLDRRNSLAWIESDLTIDLDKMD
ncbi:MAG: DUF7331 family protein [Natronomonas sp.]